MPLVRRIARPLLASVFVPSGLDQLRRPAAADPDAVRVGPRASALPPLGDLDPQTLVRVSGGVQLAAGSLLAVGRLPRMSAMALALTVVPSTFAAHRFWEVDDPAQRQQQQHHFLKNLSILGGLAIAAVDTQGRPGVGWRTRHTAEHAKAAAHRTRRQARLAAKAADRTRQAKAARTGRAVARRRAA
ncbi:MAG: DoxX family protein [Egibacteraceae bacterium]